MNISKTKNAYLAVRCLDIPLWAIFNMLPFILIKDLKASPFYLSLFIAIKPLVSVASIYWSGIVKGRPDRLKSNILIAKILSCLPFFFFPFIDHPLFIILGAAIFMSFMAGVVPAWMEVLKKNLTKEEGSQVFAWGSSLGYLGGGILPLFFGAFLDHSSHAWRFIFPLAAGCSLCAIFFISKIETYKFFETVEKTSFKETLLKPWLSAITLLIRRRDFAKYQFAFMLIGGGLMLMQPALFLYFENHLNLTYVHFAVAFSLCKGVSYALASPMWAKWLNRTDIFRFSGAITAVSSFFPLILLLATFNLSWLYIAYIIYGISQAGSELSWSMSGPLFAGKEDSSPFTSVNVFLVGIRGLIFPFLGTILCSYMDPVYIFLISAWTLLTSASFFAYYSGKKVETVV